MSTMSCRPVSLPPSAACRICGAAVVRGADATVDTMNRNADTFLDTQHLPAPQEKPQAETQPYPPLPDELTRAD